MNQAPSQEDKLISACDSLLTLWNLGKDAEPLSECLSYIGDDCLRISGRHEAMLSCYPDWQGDSVFDELLHELRTDCSTLQRQMQGRSLPPRWLEVPYSARDIRGGGMMCTVLADSWNRLGRGLRLLAVKGSRSKKVVQSLVVEVAAGLGLGFDV